jgi:hypothetical protein
MHSVTLQFLSIVALVDYLFVNPNCNAAIDHDALTLEGKLSIAAIELAINGYEATAIITSK